MSAPHRPVGEDMWQNQGENQVCYGIAAVPRVAAHESSHHESSSIDHHIFAAKSMEKVYQSLLKDWKKTYKSL